MMRRLVPAFCLSGGDDEKRNGMLAGFKNPFRSSASILNNFHLQI